MFYSEIHFLRKRDAQETDIDMIIGTCYGQKVVWNADLSFW